MGRGGPHGLFFFPARVQDFLHRAVHQHRQRQQVHDAQRAQVAEICIEGMRERAEELGLAGTEA